MRPQNYRNTILLSALLLFCSMPIIKAQEAAAKFSLIPYPTSLQAGKGSFILQPGTTIVTESAVFKQEAEQLNLLLKQYFGKPVKVSATKNAMAITMRYSAAITAEEGYALTIEPKGIIILAKEPAGMFRAVETIRQLLPADEHPGKFATKIALPTVQIRDQPVYAWRGLHLDVSRHFFSLEYLRRFIDRMALYKFNKFHLHLTDDQGWRIEIKKYPKLTAEGAWREFNNQDSACIVKSKENPDFAIDPKHIVVKNGKKMYGGFYTQEQMKGIVAYAAAKHIDIIPEVDMPGHMMAAINSYPFLTCNGENKWGKLFTTPICPCNEATFEFAQNIFTEIMEIFPSKYIHVGGDEVDRSSWEKSDECKAFMLKNNIRTTAELQSYFINRMEKFFNSKNRKLIGWDEILEDGVSSTAMVMYWRSWVADAPVKAAKNGNQVIMSPGNPLYFDNEPDQNSLANVYAFSPIPTGLTAAEAKGIVGAQANTWTERIPTEARADYMIFPRMTALAERLWSDTHDYTSYMARLIQHFPRLDALKVSYRLPDIAGMAEQNVFTDYAVLNPQKPLKNITLRYTTDGSVPNMNAIVLDKPLTINKASYVRLAAFTASGRRGDIYNLHYKQQDMAAPIVNVMAAKPGLLCDYYPGSYKSSKLMAGKPEAVYTVNEVVVPAEAKAPSFGLKYHGYLDIPADGIYSFFFTCDDGGILTIAGNETVNNDGWHGPFEKSGQAALRKGLQPIAMDFVEGGGGFTLKLKYSVNGSAPVEVPSDWLKN